MHTVFQEKLEKSTKHSTIKLITLDIETHGVTWQEGSGKARIIKLITAKLPDNGIHLKATK